MTSKAGKTAGQGKGTETGKARLPKVIIVGAGHGGTALLTMLARDPALELDTVCDVSPDAPGMVLAKGLGIATASDFEEVVRREDITAIVDVTGNPDVRRKIQKLKRPEVELIGGMSAKLMWDLIEERRRREEEMQRLLMEHKALYQVGILLSSSESPQDVFDTIVEQATGLTNCPAGSLAVFDEKSAEMYLGAARGFGTSFSKELRWKLRGGGLTSYILNQSAPVVISDVTKHPQFDNPVMIDEGVKSLVAVPLSAEGRIVGIIYVDDFNPREYTVREISTLSLLSTYAAIAIERAKLLEETRQRAITDDLTGLFNHRHFVQMLNQEVDRSSRYGRPMSLVMIDIDDFKTYNDTYGHLEGNVILTKVSEVLASQSRQVDVVARYGGEEFAIIMPETDRDSAAVMAERLRKMVEDRDFPKEQSQPGGRLTVSLGVASHPQDALTPVELISKADEALYRAKSEGRNRACSA